MHDTRQRIIDHLKEKEQATVDELADVVDLTPMAVRYHLNVLQRDNLITSPAVRRVAGRGRPQQMYTLTEAADELFPVDYFGLTGYLLDELTVQLGKKGVIKIFSNIADRLAKEVPLVHKDQTIQQRIEQLVEFLQTKGFVIDWEVQGESYLLHTYSCPYRQVAKTYSCVCLLDQKVIGSMLNTLPVRVSCLTSGDGHCTYKIPKPIQLVG